MKSQEGGRQGTKKPLAKAAVIFPCKLPFQTPTRLAVGLGLGSALSYKEYAPDFRVPRIYAVA
jgi:hypothetical protein